jgi:NADH-quinone oxidoreductase subunit J
MLAPLHMIFYLFAAIAVGSALAVITARNPVRSVLSLVVTFFAMSGIWMLLRAEFLSLILLLVYVGAVMTLFLFVVMMLNIDTEGRHSGFVRYLPFGVVIVLLMTGILVVVMGPQTFGFISMPAPAAESADFSNIQYLGNVLYTNYAYPFEIAGVVLLVAIIAAITLAYHKPKQRKVQHPSAQVNVRPEDRIRLVSGTGEL